MKILCAGILTTSMLLLSACGDDTAESDMTEQSAQAEQGILSNQQRQALDAAASVEQTLLDSAEQRQRELEARLRTQ